MRCLTLELELRSDVIQTAEASSLGVHHCLEYVKGSTLLGAAAAGTYDALGRHAYTAFHSGQVRFLDAVLLAGEGTAMLPVPLGWLHPKGSPFEADGVLVAENIHAINHLAPGEAGSLGLRQIRSGYFTAGGRWESVERRYRLKTAIDRTLGGRPDEGRLFGYESLPAGSRWQSWIEIDDDVDEEVDTMLASVFDDRLVWLGRSRAAEYGCVYARVVDRSERPGEVPPRRPEGSEPVFQAAVCLESDTALRDPDTGEPTFTVRPEDFGLPADWRLDPWRSAVLTRRYSPFNRKRRLRESERLVLRRGSVLTFAGEAGADRAAPPPPVVTSRAESGCGVRKASARQTWLRGTSPAATRSSPHPAIPHRAPRQSPTPPDRSHCGCCGGARRACDRSSPSTTAARRRTG